MAKRNITISQIQEASPKSGAKARRKVPPAPTIVRILSHLILTSRLSAITPKGGLKIATERVAIAITKAQTASPVNVPKGVEAVNPFASRKRIAYHIGRIATVTLVSKADFPQS